jgi:hypothetical protein
MNDETTSGESLMSEAAGRGRRPVLLTVLAALVGVEALLMAGVVVWLVLELVTEQPASFATAAAIVVLAAIAAVFLGLVAVNLLRAQPWTRAATLTWQLFQVVIALACFQGIVATRDAGWYLLVPAVLAIVLLFTPTVVAATKRL